LIVIKRRNFLRGALAAPAVLTLQSFNSKLGAQTYPSRPIRLIWPGATGGGPYTIVRLIAQKVEEKGATVVVEGRVGANGVVAAAAVKNASPDGYTILLGHNATHAANVTLIKDLPYNPITDFEPITLLFVLHQALIVPSSLGVKTVQELRELARSKPGGLSYASSGIGAAAHLMAEMLAKAFGAKMTHVPYANSSAARPDLLTGRVDLMFNTLPLFQGDIEAGTMKALAIASPERLKHAPDLPTLAEAGIPNIDIESWFGLFAPAKTDPAHLDILNGLFRPAAESIADSAAKQGFVIRTNTRGEFAELVKRDIVRLGTLIKDVGVQPN
jgi:tripartite-type tricarboxylate transporter receptor subunit TctC